MKTISNILATIIVALFLLSFGMKSEAVGQPCTALKDTLIIDGCPYEVNLCIYCGLTYPGYVKVDNVTPLTNCTSSLNHNELLQQAFTQLSIAPQFWFDYCNPSLPPCDGEEREILTFRMNVCWKVELLYHQGLPDTEEYYYIPCSDEYCEVEFSYCRDLMGNVISNITDYNDNYSPAPPSCIFEGSEIVLPTYLDPIGTESDCYILHTPCNPDEFEWNE